MDPCTCALSSCTLPVPQLDAAVEESVKRAGPESGAQIGFNYGVMEPGAETDGAAFGPEYNQVNCRLDTAHCTLLTSQ